MRFNADDHQDSFSPIEGQQPFRIQAVTNEMTQRGFPLIAVLFVIREGKFRGRQHTERFIVEHENPKTVEIAMGKLSSLSRAVGRPRWDDEHELEGLIGEAVFGPQKDNPQFTEIKRYVVEGEAKKAPASNPHRDDFHARGGALRSVASDPAQRPASPPLDDSEIPF